VGGRLPGRALRFPLERAARRWGFTLVAEPVTALDAVARRVSTPARTLEFDAVIVAPGSQTTFYGNAALASRFLTLDDVPQAEALHTAAREGRWRHAVVAGGGYTGVELAANLHRLFRRLGRDTRVVVVEKNAAPLSALPAAFQQYAHASFDRLGIEVRTSRTVAAADERTVRLDDGQEFADALAVWAAGVVTPDFVRALPFEKTPQGRLRVRPTLQFAPGCYAAGDAAAFEHRGRPLRMAVQFAIFQGRAAARNALRELAGQPLREWRPVDMGYVVPMANGRGCGVVLGLPVYGALPVLLHYLVSAYRAVGARNRLAVLRALLSRT
jgi:NADH dehydrogenase